MGSFLSWSGLRQTAGLYARRDIVADHDADAIQLMKEAGAVMLCVTNVSELCMWWESRNTIYGTTNNAYDTSKIVGGSSGGEVSHSMGQAAGVNGQTHVRATSLLTLILAYLILFISNM